MRSVVSELHSILSDFGPKLNAIAEDAFGAQPQPDKWSRKEVLGHLIDSAHNNLRRFIVGQYDTHPKIVYDQDFWVRVNHYGSHKKEDIVALWLLVNRQILNVLSSMDTSGAERLCDTGKEEIQLRSLRWLAEDYVKHMKHHLNQIIPGSFDIRYP